MRRTRTLWISIFLLMVISIQTATADNGKIILVAVTQSSTDLAKKIDKKRVLNNITEIASITNRTTEIYELDRFDTDITNTVHNIQSTDEDIIIFYYAGHGMSALSAGFPSFNGREQEFPQATIHEWLKNKPHQFVLTFYDTCNQKRPNRRNNNERQPSRSQPSRTLDIALINLLFNESKGDVMLCSSEYTKYSWSDEYQGGFCTYTFFKTMKDFPVDDLTGIGTVWSVFADSIQAKTNQMCRSNQCSQQNPQYQVNVVTERPNHHVMPDFFYTPHAMGWYEVIKYAESEYNQIVTLEDLLQWNDHPYTYKFKKNELVWLAPNF